MSQAWGLDNWEIGALKLGRLGTWRNWDLGSLGSWDPGEAGVSKTSVDSKPPLGPSRVITNKPNYQETKVPWNLGNKVCCNNED